MQRSGSGHTQLPSRQQYHSFQEQRPHSPISILAQATPSSMPYKPSHLAKYSSPGIPNEICSRGHPSSQFINATDYQNVPPNSGYSSSKCPGETPV